MLPASHTTQHAVVKTMGDQGGSPQAEAQALLYQKIFAHAGDAIAIIDPQGYYVEQNEAHYRLIGYSDEELQGKTPAFHLGEEVFAEVAEALASHGRYQGEVISRTKSGVLLDIDLSAFAVTDEAGVPLYYVGIKRDITERKRAKEQIERRIEQLQCIYQLNDAVTRADAVETIYDEALGGLLRALKADRAAVLLIDPDGVMRFKAWRGISEAYRCAVEGHSPWPPDTRDPQPVFIADIEAEPSLSAFQSVFQQEGIGALGFIPLLYQGRLMGKFMLYYNTPHRFTAEEAQLAQTITSHVAFAIGRKAAEAHIRELYERLRHAMTETHHRVKNNLQIIAAMVDMRLMERAEYIPAEEFQRLGSYVRTLAAVHDLLTQKAKEDGQAQSLSAREVLEKLLALMQQTAGERRITYQLEDARLSARQATSLALIANELISNALKYSAGKIQMAFLWSEDEARLEVYDEGSGFPEDFDPARDAHTGLELVERLSRWDLGGQVRFANRPEGGAWVQVTVPLAA